MSSVRLTRAPLVLLLVLSGVLLFAGRADAQVCQEFEVGSQEWQQCVEDEASGGTDDGGNKGGDKAGEKDKGGEQGGGEQGGGEQGGGGGGFEIKGPEGTACSEFSVGSKEWTDCIEGAATGGGLMPWIVIIPLGVMMIGMAIMFALQARRNRNFESFSSASIGSTAGGWLIFMGFIMGAMGVGSMIADSRADGPAGGYAIAGYTMLGVAVLCLLAGFVTMAKSRGKRRIETSGLSGQAKVMRVSQTSTYINDNPVLMFDLEVEAPGMAPYRTTAKATVPMYMTQRVGPGASIPVKVDPSKPNDVVIDWGTMSSVQSEATATPGGSFST